jgi:hypothetical protein
MCTISIDPLRMPYKCRTVRQECNMRDLWLCPHARVLRVHFSMGWLVHALHGVLEGTAMGCCIPKEECMEENGDKELNAVMSNVGFVPDCPGIDKLTQAHRLTPHTHCVVLPTLDFSASSGVQLPWLDPPTLADSHTCHSMARRDGGRLLKLKNSFCIRS